MGRHLSYIEQSANCSEQVFDKLNTNKRLHNWHREDSRQWHEEEGTYYIADDWNPEERHEFNLEKSSILMDWSNSVFKELSMQMSIVLKLVSFILLLRQYLFVIDH